MSIQTAAVIGTGMMGPGIALTLALGGVETTILSRAEESARRGLEKAIGQAKLVGENGLADPDAAARVPGLLHASTGFDDTVRQVDLVIESAPEDMEFKQDLFARMDSLAKPEAILATNTSGLSITAIQSRCSRPERVLTTHFWNPPHLMPLVELVKGERTAPEVVEEMRGLLEGCGKIAVVVRRDRPGQLGNRLQMALVREAVHIVQEGIASVEDVDLAARAGFGLRLPAYGILEHQDMVGLDMSYAITDYVARDLLNEPRAPRMLRELRDAGKLGVKTGQGFYDWSKKSAEEVRARRDAFILAVRKQKLAF
ncbi:MAG: 3-hydroxyacyl-CoA dehydrogenase family protein [Bryobacterales bacterium]|nr:3-hydroxyacyl-CoA dehydrogenase family protein [Bryobacterales bacterium]